MVEADVLVEAVEDYVARAVRPVAQRLLELEAKLQVLTLEKGERGEPGRDGVDGRDGADGKDGRDADEDAIVRRVLERTPVPADGKDGRDGVDGKDGAPGERGADGVDGKDGAPGRDGIDGKDARDGVDGKDADPEEVRMFVLETVRKAVDALPPARDGRDGRDALDGLIDMQCEHDGERRFKFVFVRSGGVRQEIVCKAPIQIYRGVHEAGRLYERGDAVTLNGCQWTALADTASTPPSADWQQSTKAGRDGRDR